MRKRIAVSLLVTVVVCCILYLSGLQNRGGKTENTVPGGGSGTVHASRPSDADFTDDPKDRESGTVDPDERARTVAQSKPLTEEILGGLVLKSDYASSISGGVLAAYVARATARNSSIKRLNRKGHVELVTVFETGDNFPAVRMHSMLRVDADGEIQQNLDTTAMVADQFLVKKTDSVSWKYLEHEFEKSGFQVVSHLPLPETAVIQMKIEPVSQFKTGTSLAKSYPEYFVYSEPNYLRSASVYPNDFRPDLWAFHNSGSDGFLKDADIDAPEAWNVRTDASNVRVAVLDTGIALSHPDFSGNLLENPYEMEANGLDDDANGVIDDHYGANFASELELGGVPGLPAESKGRYEGHGTHVAGIIGARGNNGIGVTGVAWNVGLLPVKTFTGEGLSTMDAIIRGMQYAMDRDVDIINASYGGGGYSTAESTAILAAQNKGILMVCAAGNDGKLNDEVHFYPASYNWTNIVSVAASDPYDTLAGFSNFGYSSVDIAAPGVGIYSTDWSSGFHREYGDKSGTSMAAPMISGSLALLMAEYPDEFYLRHANRILNGADRLPSLVGRVQSNGRLNLGNALAGSNPSPFNDLAARAHPLPSLVFYQSGTNHEATEEAFEAGDVYASVWYSWESDYAGTATVHLQASGFPPELTVLSGNGSEPVEEVLRSTESMVSWEMESQLSYWIRISSTDESTGTFTLTGRGPGLADNDHFEDRTVIEAGATRLKGSNVGASLEPGEQMHGGVPVTGSIWWSWTPSTDGPYLLDTHGSSIDTVLAVYKGTTFESLELVAQNDDALGSYASSVVIDAESGETYAIAVAGFNGEMGEIVLQFNRSPENDVFNEATDLGNGSIYVSGNTFGATIQESEVNAESLGGSVWYAWTPTSSDSIVLEITESDFDTVLEVFTGEAMDSLESVAFNDDQSELIKVSRVQLDAIKDTRYWIRIAAKTGSAGSFILGSSGVKPVNDQLGQALLLQDDHFSIKTHNFGATPEPGEPSLDDHPVQHSVWFRWTAPRSEQRRITTLGSDIDTVIAVYQGESISNLTLVGYDDDSGPGTSSMLEMQFIEGESYLFCVDSKSGQGFFNLNNQITGTPRNDNFANRQPLESYTTTGSNRNATTEAGEMDHASSGTEKTVWWSFTPDRDGHVVITTEGSSFDTVLAVYTGVPVANLIPLASNDDAGDKLTSLVSTDVIQGKQYQIAVGGRGNAEGEIRLSVHYVQGVVRFTDTVFSSSENSPSASLFVERTGGSSGAVEVVVSLSDHPFPADVDDDFIFSDSTLRWEDGEAGIKEVVIVIQDDPVPESMEWARFILESGNDETIVTKDFASLLIKDNDYYPGSIDQEYASPQFTGSSPVVTNMENSADGGVFVGGGFEAVNGIPMSGVVKLLESGAIDTSFSTTFSTEKIFQTIELPDGKLLVLGDFIRFHDDPENEWGLVRLNPDGSRDDSFIPFSFSTYGQVIAVQSDGRILMFGCWLRNEDLEGYEWGKLVRLNADGSLDESFQSSAFDKIISRTSLKKCSLTVIDEDHFVFIADFSSVNGQLCNRLAVFDRDGRLINGGDLNKGPDSDVDYIEVLPDGKLLLSGAFAFYEGVRTNNMAIVDQLGHLDTAFEVVPDHHAYQSGMALFLPDSGITFFPNYYDGKMCLFNHDGTFSHFVLERVDESWSQWSNIAQQYHLHSKSNPEIVYSLKDGQLNAMHYMPWGTIAFRDVEIVVPYSQGDDIEVILERYGPVENQLSYTWELESEGVQLMKSLEPVIWSAHDTDPQSIHLELTEFLEYESDRSFILRLLPAFGAEKTMSITLIQDPETITSARIAEDAIHVLAGSGENQITIHPNKVLNSRMEVYLEFVDITAENASDYFGDNRKLTWEAGDNQSKTVSYTIPEDKEALYDSTFEIIICDGLGVIVDRCLVRIDSNVIDPGYAAKFENSPLFNSRIFFLESLDSGGYLVAGEFNYADGKRVAPIGLLNEDFSWASDFCTALPHGVELIKVKPSGQGYYVRYREGGHESTIVHLRPDGSLDGNFNFSEEYAKGLNPYDSSNDIFTTDKMGNFYVVLTHDSGLGPRSVYKVLPDGSIDPVFSNNFSELTGNHSVAYKCWHGPDEMIYVAGEFELPQLGMFTDFIRVFPDGTLDESFHPLVDGYVIWLNFVSDGSMFLSGNVVTVNLIGIDDSTVHMSADGDYLNQFESYSGSFMQDQYFYNQAYSRFDKTGERDVNFVPGRLLWTTHMGNPLLELGSDLIYQGMHTGQIYSVFAPVYGVVEFDQPELEVLEGTGILEVKINRIGSPDVREIFKVDLFDGTAIEGVDFEKIDSGELVWEVGEDASKIYRIRILDNAVDDESRNFYLRITSDRYVLNEVLATVTIHDDEKQSGYAVFASDELIVDEDVGLIEIPVNRVSGSDEFLQVTYNTLDGSAVSPRNYLSASGSLVWEDGVSDVQFIQIKIVDDKSVGNERSFLLQLHNPNGVEREILVRIVDDEIYPGKIDASYDEFHVFGGEVRNFHLLSDGSLIVTGRFNYALGQWVSGILKLDSDGELDAEFGTNVLQEFYDNNLVNAEIDVTLLGENERIWGCTRNSQIFVLETNNPFLNRPDGFGSQMYLWGSERSESLYTGSSYMFYLANTDGSVVQGFNAWDKEREDKIYDVGILSDNFTLIGGDFQYPWGVYQPNLVKIDSLGNPDPSFAPSIDGSVYQIAFLGGERILLSGEFSTINEVPVGDIACISLEGEVVEDFTIISTKAFSGTIYYLGNLLIDSEGSILCGSSWENMSISTLLPSPRRYNPDGSIDTTFRFNGTVFSFIEDGTDGAFIYYYDPRFEDEQFRVGHMHYFHPGQFHPMEGEDNYQLIPEVKLDVGYVANEDVGILEIPIERRWGTDGKVSFQYEVIPGNAEQGSDVECVSGTLIWQDGEDGVKTISIPIYEDALVEGVETFTIELSNLTNASNFTAEVFQTEDWSDELIYFYRDHITVRIIDNDYSYGQWKGSLFSYLDQLNEEISGDLADPDSDLLSNFSEYCLGMNPQTDDQSEAPYLHDYQIGGESCLQLTYKCQPTGTEVTYGIEMTKDGVNWFIDDSHLELVSEDAIGGGWRQRTVRCLDSQVIGMRLALSMEDALEAGRMISDIVTPHLGSIRQLSGTQQVFMNQEVRVSADVFGTGDMHYQWYTGEPGDTSRPIAGANESSLVMDSLGESTTVWLELTTAQETLSSDAFPITVWQPPVITSQPQSIFSDWGRPGTMRVEAEGEGVVYAWYNSETGEPVPGGDAADLSIADIREAASFHVVVSNPSGSVVSVSARIRVGPKDEDFDGMPDAWEMTQFQSLNEEPTTDSDGDKQSNLFEFLAQTDPNDPSSRFTAVMSAASSQVEISISPYSQEREYQLWSSQDCVNWTKKEADPEIFDTKAIYRIQAEDVNDAPVPVFYRWSISIPNPTEE